MLSGASADGAACARARKHKTKDCQSTGDSVRGLLPCFLHLESSHLELRKLGLGVQ